MTNENLAENFRRVDEIRALLGFLNGTSTVGPTVDVLICTHTNWAGYPVRKVRGTRMLAGKTLLLVEPAENGPSAHEVRVPPLDSSIDAVVAFIRGMLPPHWTWWFDPPARSGERVIYRATVSNGRGFAVLPADTESDTPQRALMKAALAGLIFFIEGGKMELAKPESPGIQSVHLDELDFRPAHMDNVGFLKGAFIAYRGNYQYILGPYRHCRGPKKRGQWWALRRKINPLEPLSRAHRIRGVLNPADSLIDAARACEAFLGNHG